ncbi:MAG: PorV/PorQ family protein [Chloroherpetonaceae bacterium]|nr:PorV/PorQ family protein [Chloroherpetonaceae bacterium]
MRLKVNGRMKRTSALFLAMIIAIIGGMNRQEIHAQSRVATTAAQFLGIGIGPRAVAMGGAQIASRPDVMSLYWNPAGIARNDGLQIGSVHSVWLAGTSINWAGLTAKTGFGTFGIGATLLSSGDIERTTEAQPDGTGEFFSTNDLAIQFSYAVSLTDQFSIGGSLKFINQSIWRASAQGVALDLGLLYNIEDRLRVAATMYNFGTQMAMSGNGLLITASSGTGAAGENNGIPAMLGTESWNLPLVFKIGLSYDLIKDNENLLIIALDGVAPNDNDSYFNLGAEYGWHDLLYFRVGYNTLFLNEAETGLAFGLGVKYMLAGLNFRFDYSYQTFGRLSAPQWLSLSLQF